jgi:hypothetical protein
MHSKIDLYKQLPPFPGNSLTPHLDNIKKLIKSTKSKTALDYGCGNALHYIKDKIHLSWGLDKMGLYDPAILKWDCLPGDNFDCVICTDVLEHVPEREINKTLEEIFTLSNKCVYLNIAMYPARQILPNGENAHCTLKPKQWWRYRIAETIKENIKVHVVYSYTHGNKNTEYEIYTKK